MDFNWKQLFLDFSQSLVGLVKDMNEELNAYISAVDCDTDCGKTIAQIHQLDSDIDKVLKFIDTQKIII